MAAWGLLLIVLGAVAAMPWLAERRRFPADVFREKAPGRFAKLSDGVTHYQWLGPDHGPVVVCIHGLTTPSPVWYAVAQGLGRLGYRVLVYDLYGRGFSDAPKGAQTGTFFVRQLEELLTHQKLDEKVTVLGFSMGGSIAAVFARTHPSRVRRLVLLAPSGVWMREDRLADWARRLPVLGDWMHHILIARRDRKALREQLGKHVDIKGIVELQLAEFDSQGYLRSVLSSRRNMLAQQLEETHREIGRIGVPVIGIWGKRDEVIPLRSLGTLTQWNRTVRQEVIPDADHRLLYTHSAQILDVLASVLDDDAS